MKAAPTSTSMPWLVGRLYGHNLFLTVISATTRKVLALL
jgi:hypothetical protein